MDGGVVVCGWEVVATTHGGITVVVVVDGCTQMGVCVYGGGGGGGGG